MRTRTAVLLTALLAVPAAARAQDATPSPPPGNGSVDFGGQFTSVSGDEARYQRYRDLRTGVMLDGFHYTRERNEWSFSATASHVGYRDQKYTAAAERPGRLKISFSWDQIPLFYSKPDSDQFGAISATSWTVESPGVYRLPDTLQAAVQGKQITLYNAITQSANTLEVRQRRDIADLSIVFSASKSVDFKFHLVETMKKGEQPWAATFGFSNAIELAGPLDHRTTDLSGVVEWGSERGTLRAGYDGSFFTNNVQTLVWDNPMFVTDSPTDGSSQGRQALWPDSSTNGFSVTAAYNLPHHTRAFGNASFSKWGQDGTLLPHTINSALPVIPLARSTADVSADVTGAYLGLTSRPTDNLWLSTRYKLYDYDNTTPEFPVTQAVRADQTVEAWEPGSTSIFSYKRQYFDADMSYNLSRFTALKFGYGVETDRRTFRQFEKTADHTVRVSLDTTGLSWLMFRAQYDYSKRTGTGLDEEVFDADNEGSAEPRQFDVSDRNRNRLSVMGTLMTNQRFDVSVTGGFVNDKRPDAPFGLQKQDGGFFSIGLDATPVDKVDLFLEYGYEKYSSLQKSRQANPGTQEFDPTRDWTTDGSDRANTVLAGATLKQVVRRTDIDWSLEYSDAADSYLYGLRSDQTIFTTVPLAQLPGFHMTRTQSVLNAMISLNRRLSVGGGWLFETYDTNDFAWSPDTLNALSLPRGGGSQQIILTRYMYRPYTGNTGFVRLRYLF
jgi:MtrB/PioB family decaheme-associated outer membrane protein